MAYVRRDETRRGGWLSARPGHFGRLQLPQQSGNRHGGEYGKCFNIFVPPNLFADVNARFGGSAAIALKQKFLRVTEQSSLTINCRRSYWTMPPTLK